MDRAARWAGAWVIAGIGLCAGTPALADEAWSTGPPCQLVAGQVVINGQWQQVTGVACLQPDGSWQLVDGSGGAYYSTPYYYDDDGDAWNWAPVAVGYGAAFIFVDRHHHVHPMHHVYFRYGGGAGWGGRGFRAMPPGGYRGGMGGGAGRGMAGGMGGGMGGAHGGGFHGGGHR
ncbi:hypothetical protein K2O51_08905 [Cupriavidus pinatubonensis]|uniref:hypothetical protein n=1 Tax=Cupriavidus pinatubonensis TaxID=248026 RepID=UPI0015E30874|nr:hypothetical protein [Cupriavidus pinatubonensis]QYY28027.1 hypothetical protein K2O51_08905 [Cupriavidus pinatubonensis]TPQ36772.1 hypothetical protein C2U69_17835 [Cupriavidus pinatubonensis]